MKPAVKGAMSGRAQRARKPGFPRPRLPLVSRLAGLLAALVLLMGIAKPARAQTLQVGPFQTAQMSSGNQQAGATGTQWDLVLLLPVPQAVSSFDTATIVVVFPGTTDPSRGAFGVAGVPFVSSVSNGGFGGEAGYLRESISGDAQSGLRLHITYSPIDFWYSGGDPDTFHLFGISNPKAAGTYTLKTLASGVNSDHVAVTYADSTPMYVTIQAGPVAGYRMQNSLNGPGAIPQQTAGTPFTYVVSALDQFGNIPNVSQQVFLADSTHTLTPTSVQLAFGQAVVSPAHILRAMTADYIRAYDGAQHSGVSNTFNVLPGAISHFTFGAMPSGIVANHPFNVSIQARDAFENVATSYAGTPIASDVTGMLTPASAGPFVAGVWNGQFTVPDPIGSDTITVGSITLGAVGRSAAFRVAAQSLAAFAVTGPPGSVQAGTTFPLSVRAVDSTGVIIRGYAGSAQLADSSGSLSPTVTGVFVQGVWSDTAKVLLATTGDRVRAFDGSGHAGISAPFDVLPGAPAALKLSGYPGTAEARVAFPLTVAAVDVYGNVVPSVTGQGTLDDTAHRISPTTIGPFSSGLWSGNVSVSDSVASDVITATLPHGNAVLIGSSQSIRITSAQLHGFSVSGGEATRTAGVPFDVVIRALDGSGGVLTDFTGTVALTDSSGTLVPTGTGAFVAGVTTVSATVTRSGIDVIRAADGAGHSGSSGPFTVLPGPLARLSWLILAEGPIQARVPFGLAVSGVDAFGNILPGFSGPVSLSDSTGTLTPASWNTFGNGTANIQVTIGRGIGLDWIQIATPGLAPVRTATFQVSGATAQLLALEPASLRPGQSATLLVLGHFFEPGASVEISPDVSVSGVQVLGPDTLKVSASVSQVAAVGPRRVTLTQAGTAVFSDSLFRVAFRAPTLLALAPAVLARTARAPVTLVGHDFVSTTSVSLGPQVTVNGFFLTSAETLVADVSVDSLAALGARTVTVTSTYGAASASDGFMVVDRPAIAFLRPDSAQMGDVVEAHGSGFEFIAGDTSAVDSVRLGAHRFTGRATDGTLLTFVAPDDSIFGPRALSIRSYGAWSLPVTLRMKQPLRGDVNGDGRVAVVDVALALGGVVGRTQLSGRALYAADCDGNGSVDVLDLLCIVDAAVSSGAGSPSLGDGVPTRGTALWDGAAGALHLPAEAVAVQWRAGVAPGVAAAADPARFALSSATRARGSISGWVLSGAQVTGVAALLEGSEASLPSSAGQPSEVLWADALGHLYQATLATPAPPRAFETLRNPQRGTLWFAVPSHLGAASLSLYSADGREVNRRELGAGEAGQLSWQPRSHLPAGLYFARYRDATRQTVVKIVYLP